jgi:hypothetical protein
MVLQTSVDPAALVIHVYGAAQIGHEHCQPRLLRQVSRQELPHATFHLQEKTDLNPRIIPTVLT